MRTMLVKERMAKERQEVEVELIKYLGENYTYVIEYEFDCTVEEFVNSYMRKRYVEDKISGRFFGTITGEYQDEKGKYDWICEI